MIKDQVQEPEACSTG